MVARWFCDICDAEVENTDSQPEFIVSVRKPDDPVHGAMTKLEFRFLRAIDGTWNAGNVCNGCLTIGLNEVIRIMAEQTKEVAAVRAAEAAKKPGPSRGRHGGLDYSEFQDKDLLADPPLRSVPQHTGDCQLQAGGPCDCK